MTEPLTIDEILALLNDMEARALADADLGAWDDESSKYWEGWAAGLATLRQHIRTGVKATCFPVGSCDCHPFTTAREEFVTLTPEQVERSAVPEAGRG